MSYADQILKASETARTLGQITECRNVALLFEQDGNLEEIAVVGPPRGSRARDVLVLPNRLDEVLASIRGAL